MKKVTNKVTNTNTNRSPLLKTGIEGCVRQGWRQQGYSHVVNQRKPCSKDQLFNNKELLIGTLNVRTLNSAGQLNILLHQIRDYKWSVTGLCETRWTGAGEFNKDGCKIIFRKAR